MSYSADQPSGPVPPTKVRLIITRSGHSIATEIPKPVVVVDTREQMPYTFANHRNWISVCEVEGLPTGDYSVRGMESLMSLERKTLNDIIICLTQGRKRFFRMCERLAEFKHKTILIEASYETIKSPYADLPTDAHPNGISGSLDAIEAKWGIPIIYTSKLRALAEERAASWLSKHYTYWYLEKAGRGRWLVDGDL